MKEQRTFLIIGIVLKKFWCTSILSNLKWNREGRNLNEHNIVSWEPEGHYCRSKMFRWEPEGRCCCTKSMAIGPIRYCLYKVNGNSALLVLNGTSLICNSALLALSWRHTEAYKLILIAFLHGLGKIRKFKKMYTCIHRCMRQGGTFEEHRLDSTTDITTALFIL